tara:strand:+ start:188 stop:358 length:171 start_codon:yes stop_codon:yes gene_type:complete
MFFSAATVCILLVGLFALCLCKVAANADKAADRRARVLVRKHLKEKETDANNKRGE